VVALAQVAGADLDDAVREPSAAMVPSAGRVISSSIAGACSGRGVGEDLDLVELVGPQHAAGVAPAEPASRR
jgi:hypothetical protein